MFYCRQQCTPDAARHDTKRGRVLQIASSGRPVRAARTTCRASKLAGVEMAPADPILGVSEAFKKDDSPDKLNLGVGAYRTDELQPCVPH